MDAKIVLREITAAAEHFAQLHQIAGCDSDACIQSQAIALDSFQLEADPVVLRTSPRGAGSWAADEILDHGLELAVVEQIAHGHTAADLRNLDGGAGLLADVLECAVALILEAAASARDTCRPVRTLSTCG